MLRTLLAIFLLAAAPAHAGLRRVEANVHAFTLLVEFFDGGHCSATKIGRSEILIAAHCVEGDPQALIIKQSPVEVVSIVRGPGDQARVTIRAQFKRWASIGDRPTQGDPIFIFGNPGDERDLLRRGYIAGERMGFLLADLPIWKGDSGSAVFNEHGQVVGIVVMVTAVYPTLHLAVIQPVGPL